jgi:hypothetical protein
MKLADRMSILRAAAVLFLAIVAPLKASPGQPVSENSEGVDKTPATLPDVRALLQRQQLLRDAKKYELCRTELAEIIDLSDLPPTAAEPKWIELESQARKLGIGGAFSDARAVYAQNNRLLKRRDSFGIAIYSRTRWHNRQIFVVDLLNTRIASFKIQHGRGNFQNEGRNRSSLGCFIGGVDIKSTAFNLHGFDGRLNSLACERRLQVHVSQSRGARLRSAA